MPTVLALAVGAALAEEPAPKPAAPRPEAALNGDVKLFFLAGAPDPWFGFSDEAVALLDAVGTSEEEALDAYGLGANPFAQGVASGRLKAAAELGPVRLDAHWAIAGSTTSTSTSVVGFGTGVGLRAPELLPLTWAPDTGGGVSVQHRFDRLVLSAKLPHVDVALGRQPVSFGVGRVFTPMDLVNPFHPATIDTEYKPGVDAVRADAYAGTSGKLTVVAAWAGDPIAGEAAEDPADPVWEDVVLAASGQVTVGVTDLLAFAGNVRAEPVFGLGTASAIGPVGVHAEATLTLPADEADPFVRAVAGADWRPTGTTTLTGEAYLQSLGATDPEDYLAALDDPRVARGELWAMGQLYASVAVAQEVTPLVHANLAVVGNLRDPSALVSLGGSWSVSDDAVVALGAYLGAGERPDRIELGFAVDPETLAPTLVPPSDDALAASVNSEFGLYPAMGFVQMRTYF